MKMIMMEWMKVKDERCTYNGPSYTTGAVLKVIQMKDEIISAMLEMQDLDGLCHVFVVHMCVYEPQTSQDALEVSIVSIVSIVRILMTRMTIKHYRHKKLSSPKTSVKNKR